MTTPPLTVGATSPAPKNLLARFIGVLTAPRDTFASVAAHPKWLAMLALTAVVVAIFTALPLTTDAGRQAALDQQVTQMQSFGMTVSDQMYEQMEKGTARMPYITGITVLVMTPIIGLIIAVFLIWYIIVLAIGLAVLYRRRTQPIAISLLSVYAVIAIVVALIKSRVGGA
jgi:small-conductance mechanosensitive channel